MTALEITWFDEVDSTSRLAREYLNQKTENTAIHAFAARCQVVGVGRQGRKWESGEKQGEGNLFLSIAFPGDTVPQELRDILPLAVGVATVQWLERAASIRPVLKWPNDIVLDGLKVGGILCEATVNGATWGGVVVGIGINLVSAPTLGDEAGYRAGSVLSATGIRLLARLACEALGRQIVHTVTESMREVVLNAYRQCATAPGQLWRARRDGSLWQQEPFDGSGNLSLRSWTTGEFLQLKSSEHEYGWTGMDGNRNALLVADVGNTRIKLGLCERSDQGLQIVKSIAWTPGSEDGSVLLKFIQSEVAAGVPPLIHAASVNPQNYGKLTTALESHKIMVREIRRGVVRNTASKYDLKKIGLDRFVGVEAALALRAWGLVSGPLVVASAGTATTIDFIDGAGIHVGGLIGAGVTLAQQALNNGTAALPLVIANEHGSEGWSVIPVETRTAIASAAVRMNAAWIERETVEWAARLGSDVANGRLLITGGHADSVIALLSESCRDIVYPAPTLNLLGVGILASSVG